MNWGSPSLSRSFQRDASRPSGQFRFESVEAAIREKFKGAVGDGNVAAAREAYEAAAA